MAIKTVNITELANIERSSGKVYPAGCTLIQVSATNGQVLYHVEEAEIPTKYAVVTANDKVLPKYLYHMISFRADAFISLRESIWIFSPVWIAWKKASARKEIM